MDFYVLFCGTEYDSGIRIANITSAVAQYTFNDDYDLVLIVTGATGENNFNPTYNGVTYSQKEGYMWQSYKGSVVIIQHVKANTQVTFSRAAVCTLYGYKYT